MLREQNIKKREDFFASLLKDPLFAETIDAINTASRRHNSIEKVKRRRSFKDETFKFTGRIPTEIRRSSRLQNVPPLYTEQDLVDDKDIYKYRRKTFDDCDSEIENIEEVIYPIKTKRKCSRGVRTKHVYIPVEEVTQSMLDAVSKRVCDKVYSENGSSCHQCRQKTRDQKTSCRNDECFGVRGQFCGVCLENRYVVRTIILLKE